MIKKMFLYFLCFTLVLSIPDCKKNLPTTPDIPEIILPSILFIATPTSIMLDSFSTLSWITENATNVTIDQGIGTVSATGTMEVSPSETTTYTLTATNNAGQSTKFCIVKIKKWAILDIVANPGNPMFNYDPLLDICTSYFTVVINEIGGVGGRIDGLIIGGFLNADTLCSTQEFDGGSFNSFGSFSRYCDLVIQCKPTIVIIYITGVDNNSYLIDKAIFFTITWTQSSGLMRFLKIVEGASHHKLIK